MTAIIDLRANSFVSNLPRLKADMTGFITERVWKMARRIAAEEACDGLVVQLAALPARHRRLKIP